MSRTVALIVLVGAIVAAATTLVPRRSAAVCSVLSHYPCVYHPYHQVCSVFRRRACTPEPLYPFGEQLQLTIDSGQTAPAQSPADEQSGTEPRKLNTIRDVFAALRRCWVPPAPDQVRPGVQLAIRLSFKRNGEPFGEPRLTYVTPGISEQDRQSFWEAVQATLHRCAPLAFSSELGGALAGRPFAIRFVDNRPRS
jgi:hypothetical protein